MLVNNEIILDKDFCFIMFRQSSSTKLLFMWKNESFVVSFTAVLKKRRSATKRERPLCVCTYAHALSLYFPVWYSFFLSIFSKKMWMIHPISRFINGVRNIKYECRKLIFILKFPEILYSVYDRKIDAGTGQIKIFLFSYLRNENVYKENQNH